MFFYANYEGSNNKAIFGGGRATVPTEAMRNGDFRGTAIAPRDPTTGQPFADRVIPSGRIDPAARAIMDFFYPLPNQGTMANGYGVYQQFVPQTRDRQRGDIRIDYEPQHQRFGVRPRELSAPQSKQHHLRGGQRVHQPAGARIPRSTRRPRSAVGPRSSRRRSSTNSAPATTMTTRGGRARSWQRT